MNDVARQTRFRLFWCAKPSVIHTNHSQPLSSDHHEHLRLSIFQIGHFELWFVLNMHDLPGECSLQRLWVES
jgi:hypothetical protein